MKILFPCNILSSNFSHKMFILFPTKLIHIFDLEYLPFSQLIHNIKQGIPQFVTFIVNWIEGVILFCAVSVFRIIDEKNLEKMHIYLK